MCLEEGIKLLFLAVSLVTRTRSLGCEIPESTRAFQLEIFYFFFLCSGGPHTCFPCEPCSEEINVTSQLYYNKVKALQPKFWYSLPMGSDLRCLPPGVKEGNRGCESSVKIFNVYCINISWIIPDKTGSESESSPCFCLSKNWGIWNSNRIFNCEWPKELLFPVSFLDQYSFLA